MTNIDNHSKAIIFNRITELEVEIDRLAIKLSETSNVRTYKKLERKIEDLLILRKLNEAILYKDSSNFRNKTLQ